MLLDPSTYDVKYVGMSNNLQRRAHEHKRNPAFKDLKFKPDAYTDIKAEQRGREQILYNKYIKKGPLLNKRMPVAKKFWDQFLPKGKKVRGRF